MLSSVSISYIPVPQQQGVRCASHAATSLSVITKYNGPFINTPLKFQQFITREIPLAITRNQHTFVNQFCGMEVIRPIIGDCTHMLIQKTGGNGDSSLGWEKQIFLSSTAAHPPKRSSFSHIELKHWVLKRNSILPVIINLGAHWVSAFIYYHDNSWTIYYMDSLGGRMPIEVRNIITEN